MTIAIYTRSHTAASKESQLLGLQAALNKFPSEAIAAYHDEGTDTTARERLLAEIEHCKDINTVLVWDLTRLSRNGSEIVERMSRHGVPVVEVSRILLTNS